MKKKINIAVIGCSAIANKTVIPTIKSHPSFNLVIVGSRSIEKSATFAKKFDCRSGTYDDVLNSTDVDAVYISLPTGLHYEWGKKALMAGKHILLEKPFTSILQEAENVINLADKKGLIAMEALPYVYHSYFVELKRLLDTKIIGDVKLIESSFGFPHLAADDIRYNAKIGGGAILDNLIYPLSASILLMGDNFISKSYNIVYNHKLNIDECGFLRLDWEDRSANINYGFGFSYKNKIDIWGTAGTISIDRAFTKPADMDADILINTNNKTETKTVPAVSQFYLMIEAFYNKVMGYDITLKNQGNDIIKRMKIISEMYLSKGVKNE